MTLRPEGPVYSIIKEALFGDRHVLHWCAPAWRRIDVRAWDAFHGLHPSWSPLPGVRAGDHRFVVCCVKDGRLRDIAPHRYLIDDAGRIIDGHCFGVLSGAETERLEFLAKARPINAAERAELEALRGRLWRSWLPPLGALQQLPQVLGALPDEEDAAWQAFEACGVVRSTLVWEPTQ